MTARRQPSTTSLAKFARGSSPGPHNRSFDFCNAFWGLGDGGVDVLFARMRGASRTMEELRNFWKERASIEDDYARRLAKLAKQTLGRDEIGELRSSLDTIRVETERQASFHLTLAQQVRADLETQTAAFLAKQQHHKKTYQSAIEKEFKAKQTQEGYVTKARDKYENDYMRINSYTAQLGLVQGKDAERIHLKLERAQQTVVQNERDFANFARALVETVAKWEQDWKVFCDSCQDLEDDRLGFTKDNMWAYANAVSTACEHMRLALEQMEPDKDQESFVRDYGTGNQIPDPPAFVNYSDPNAVPSSSSNPTFRHANFPRSSQRPPPVRRASIQPEAEEEPLTNTAGVGAGGGARRGDDSQSGASVSRRSTQSRRDSAAPPVQAPSPTNGSLNGGPSSDVSRRPTTKSVSPSYRVPPRDPLAEPLDPTAETFIKVGNNAYKVDLSKDPTQQQGGASSSSSRAIMSSSAADGGAQSGSVRRRSIARADTRGTQPRRGTMESAMQNARPSSSFTSTATIRPGSRSPTRDYSNTAEDCEVLTDYQQSLPGERKSVTYTGAPPSPGPIHPQTSGHSHNMSQGQDLVRPPSQGYAGVGVHGSRSASPQPIYISPPPSNNMGSMGRSGAASPNNVGIVLDPNGRQQQQQQRHSSLQQQAPPPQAAYNPNTQGQGRLSYAGHVPPPPPIQQQPGYGAVTPYQPPAPQPSYMPPPPPVQPAYSAPVPYQPPPQRHPVYQPQPHTSGYGTVNGLQHNVSASTTGGGWQQQQHAPPPQQQQQQQQLVRQPQQQQLAAPASGTCAPVAVPAGSGHGPGADIGRKWILFYVKALFNYTATIDEEFDFQEGDIIAVTATPEDGWWSGELLDESRRFRGKHIFPSNFVVLF
ncbi:SH3 domain-containing protein [Mycena rebaudengoi]|nr:SH3 domain-containing protein [Mycena rebaudengoi]